MTNYFFKVTFPKLVRTQVVLMSFISKRGEMTQQYKTQHVTAAPGPSRASLCLRTSERTTTLDPLVYLEFFYHMTKTRELNLRPDPSSSKHTAAGTVR